MKTKTQEQRDIELSLTSEVKITGITKNNLNDVKAFLEDNNIWIDYKHENLPEGVEIAFVSDIDCQSQSAELDDLFEKD